MGPRCPALPVLSRLRGARPEARRARRLAGSGPLCPDRPPVVRGPRVHRAGRHAGGSRATAVGRAGDRHRRGRPAADPRRGRPPLRRRARRRPHRRLRRVVRPAALRPEQRPARRSRLRPRRGRVAHCRQRRADERRRACGSRATSPTHAPRSSRPPGKDLPPPSPSTPISSRKTCTTRCAHPPAPARPRNDATNSHTYRGNPDDQPNRRTTACPRSRRRASTTSA